MTQDEFKAYRAEYARENTNKKYKMVRIPNELHARLKATGKPIHVAIAEALDKK